MPHTGLCMKFLEMGPLWSLCIDAQYWALYGEIDLPTGTQTLLFMAGGRGTVNMGGETTCILWPGILSTQNPSAPIYVAARSTRR